MDPIYCIREASGCVRYLGVTSKFPEQRLAEHLYEAKSTKKKTHRLNWLRGLDQPPMIEVIEWVLPGDRVEREKYWISLFKDYGHKLVNGTDGGEGTPGRKYVHSIKTRAKLRVSALGRKEISDETRKKMSVASSIRKYPNRKVSPAVWALMSAPTRAWYLGRQEKNV